MALIESLTPNEVELSAAVQHELQVSHATMAELEAARRRIRGLLQAAFPTNWDPHHSTLTIDVIAVEILSGGAVPSASHGVTEVINETRQDVVLKVGNADPEALLADGNVDSSGMKVIRPQERAWIAKHDDTAPALVCQAVGVRYFAARPIADGLALTCDTSGWERGCRADGRATSIHVGWPEVISVRDSKPGLVEWYVR